MNLALVITVPLAAVFALSCSAPPSPPPQGAVTIAVQPAGGSSCDGSHNFLSIPTQTIASEVNSELIGCDRSQGCSPDAQVAVDRDNGYTVTCSVSPTSDGQFTFTVSATSTTLTFNASGTVSSTGGPNVTVGSFDSLTQKSRGNNSCVLTIAPNTGGVQKGEIWAQFQCDAFNETTSASNSSCNSSGAFIFENCDG